MADPPRRPNPADLRRRADELHERASAVPPFPKAVRHEEKTQVEGVLEPAPFSAPQPPRSYSPPPFASPAEQAAIAREARREHARVEKPPESRAEARATVVVHEYRLDPGTRNWLRGLVVMVLGALGFGVYGAVKPSDGPPPLESLTCQQRCPLGNRQPIPRGLPPLELQVTLVCCEAMQARLDSETALSEAAKARELAGKASDKATLVEKNQPTVNP